MRPVSAEFEKEMASGGAVGTAKAARLFGVHPTTVGRWITAGSGGTKLESVRQPNGRYITTAGAVTRFLARVKATMGHASIVDDSGLAACVRFSKAVLDAAGI